MKRQPWIPIVLTLLVLVVVIVRYRRVGEEARYWVQLRQLNKQVLALENTGQNTRCARQILTEADWLLDSTRDLKRVAQRLDNLRASR